MSPSLGSLLLWFLIPGLFQGAALHIITDVWEANYETSITLLSLVWFVAIAPIAHHLVTLEKHRVSAAAMAIGVAGLCAFLFWSISHRFQIATVPSSTYDGDTGFPLQTAIICTLILCSHILPFYRAIVQRKVKWNTYNVLFEYSWNQTIALAVAGLFTLLIIAILFLTVGLFGILGIELKDLILRKDVMFVVSGGAFGLGIGLTRTKDSIVHSMRGLLLSLLRAILPILLLITLAFVSVAIITGLNNIETSWSVAYILLLAIGLCITLCSAAVGDSEAPVSPMLNKMCRTQSVIILLMALLAAWAIWQRIDQYGLTHSRIIASLAVGIALLYGLGYSLAAFSKSLATLIQQSNVLIALFSVAIAIAIQTPMIDTVRIAAYSQLKAFQENKISAEQIDLAYLYYEAGQAGQEVIEALRQDPRANEPPLAEKFTLLEDSGRYYKYRDLEREIVQLTTLDDNIAAASDTLKIFTSSGADPLDDAALRTMLTAYTQFEQSPFNSTCFKDLKPCFILEAGTHADTPLFLLAMRTTANELYIDWWSESLPPSELLYDLSLPRPGFALHHRVVLDENQLNDVVSRLERGELPLVDITVKALAIGEKRILVPLNQH